MRMMDWDQILSEHGAMVWRTAYRLLGGTPVGAAGGGTCQVDLFAAAAGAERRARATRCRDGSPDHRSRRQSPPRARVGD